MDKILIEVAPVLIELVKTGKAIGLAYFAVVGIVPIVVNLVKWIVGYLSLKYICDTVLSMVKYFYIQEPENAKKSPK